MTKNEIDVIKNKLDKRYQKLNKIIDRNSYLTDLKRFHNYLCTEVFFSDIISDFNKNFSIIKRKVENNLNTNAPLLIYEIEKESAAKGFFILEKACSASNDIIAMDIGMRENHSGNVVSALNRFIEYSIKDLVDYLDEELDGMISSDENINDKKKDDEMKDYNKILFISHSSDDGKLIDNLSQLLRLTIDLGDYKLRVSSNPAFGFRTGKDISSEIKKELNGDSILIGFISQNSLLSSWVLFELGIAWAKDKAFILIDEGINHVEIPAGLKNVKYQKIYRDKELLSFITDISERIKRPMKKPTSVVSDIATFLNENGYDNKFRITKAIYGSGDNQANVTKKLRTYISNDQLKIIGSMNNYLEIDPICGKDKILKIDYYFNTDYKSKEYKENEDIELPY